MYWLCDELITCVISGISPRWWKQTVFTANLGEAFTSPVERSLKSQEESQVRLAGSALGRHSPARARCVLPHLRLAVVRGPGPLRFRRASSRARQLLLLAYRHRVLL